MLMNKESTFFVIEKSIKFMIVMIFGVELQPWMNVVSVIMIYQMTANLIVMEFGEGIQMWTYVVIAMVLVN